MTMPHTLSLIILILGGLLLVVGGFVHLRCSWHAHQTLLGIEKDLGNLGIRRRLWVAVIRDKATIDRVMPAEKMCRGWVWVRVSWRPPAHRGERPMDAHDETIEWALTRRGAKRKQRNAPPPGSPRR